MKKRFCIFAVVAALLFLATPLLSAPSYYDGNFTNVLLKGYLTGKYSETLDNMTDGYWIATVPAAGVFQVKTGNLMIGDGTPDVTLNGEDAYVNGTLEVDGNTRLDGTTLTLRGVAYTLPAADGAASEYLQTNGSGTLSWASGTSGSLDDAYNSGVTITADAGAVAITNNAADNNGVLTLEKSPAGAQSGDLLTITAGAQASGDLIQLANSGSGNDIAGTGGTWYVTKSGAISAVSGVFSGALSAASVTVTGPWTIGTGASTVAVNSSSWDITSAGAVSGVTTLGMSGDLTLSAGDVYLANGKAVKGSTTTAETIKVQGYDVDNTTYRDAITITNGNTIGIAVGSNNETVAINSADWDISATGDMTGIGAITADGLITGTLGLVTSGANSTINHSSNFTTGINTGTSTGALSLGGGNGTVAVDSTTWDVSTAGAFTGVTGVTFAAGEAATVTLASNGAADDLTISLTGANDASLVLASAGTGADALQITASAGGIDISGAAGGDIDITSTGKSVNITATEAAADQIKLSAEGTIAGNAINVATTDGGIVLTAAGAANGDMTLTVGDDFALNATGAASITSEDWGISSTGAVTKIASVGFDSGTTIYHDTIECDNACIKALSASPKELVAAPGANKFIELVSAVLILDYGSEALTETADDMVIQYNTSGADITAAIDATGFIDAAADTIKIVQPSAAITVAAANMVNKAVELFNSGDGEYGGNATADTTMTIKVAYRIHADGL